jgi:hypothetical protein
MTVAKLRELLAGLDPETFVVIATDDWFVHVSEAISPAKDEDYVALTLFPGGEWDSRRDV